MKASTPTLEQAARALTDAWERRNNDWAAWRLAQDDLLPALLAVLDAPLFPAESTTQPECQIPSCLTDDPVCLGGGCRSNLGSLDTAVGGDTSLVDAGSVNVDSASGSPASPVGVGGNKHLPYEKPAQLWRAFQSGEKFNLHYHGEVREVTGMTLMATSVYVVAGAMLPVHIWPDGTSKDDGSRYGPPKIWLAPATQVDPATPTPEAKSTVSEPSPPVDTAGGGDGWIAWGGGEQPVPHGTTVWVRFPNNVEPCLSDADSLDWTHDDTGVDIVAYKLAPKQD